MPAVAEVQPIFWVVPVIPAAASFFQNFSNAKPCLYIIHTSNGNDCPCFFGYSAKVALFKFSGFGFPICTGTTIDTVYQGYGFVQSCFTFKKTLSAQIGTRDNIIIPQTY